MKNLREKSYESSIKSYEIENANFSKMNPATKMNNEKRSLIESSKNNNLRTLLSDNMTNHHQHPEISTLKESNRKLAQENMLLKR